jgi:hypothetical protein
MTLRKMITTLHERHGFRVLAYASDGKLRNDRDASNLIGEALSQRADWVLIPVECLDDDFFRLKTRIAGEIIQKFVNYRLRLVIVGDISRFVDESDALRDFIYESNRGDQVWFLPNVDEFAERLDRASTPWPEPWLRGPIDGVDTLTVPILYSFEQAREDLERHLEGLSADQIWATPFGLASVGFHVRHIGRSADRLTSYLEGRQLSADQLEALGTEHEPASIEELFGELGDIFMRVEQVFRSIDPATLRDSRTVGRKKLRTTVIGLLTHIAEHTQRHVGQAISAAKLVRQTTSFDPRPDGTGLATDSDG